jgi:hypothetical protein
MKTPMQELINKLKQLKYSEINEQAWDAYDSVMDIAEELLEKEKETMVDFAYKCRNLMAADEFAISKWYDETFNTKEK